MARRDLTLLLSAMFAAGAGVSAAGAPVAPAAPVVAAPIQRVVLIDSTPELAHAARTALAPWAIEVVEAPSPVAMDDAGAISIAYDRGADRIAWLAGDELVVLDPATGLSERRPAPDGAGDAAAAAAVALSLKTLLRLPPPAEVAPAPPAIDVAVEVPPPPPPARRVRIVPEVGGGIRFPLGGTLDAQPRVTVGLGIAHPRRRWLRPSIVVGFGPSVDAGRAGLQGTWSDLELGIQLAVALPISTAWAIVPRARLALHRTHLAGRLPSQTDMDETDLGGEAGLDLALWWRAGRVHAGAGVGLGLYLGLPDHDRMNVMVFDSPTAAGQVFGSLLVDL